MILLNTCHIREKAAEKVYSELGRLKPLREANPDLKIGVAGCVAQAEGEEIMRRQPMVDLVVGPQTYHRLPKMMEALGRGKRRSTPISPKRTSSPTCPRTARKARADGVPDRAGRLRQVLFLLRRALHARGGGLAPGRTPDARGARPGGARRARDHASGQNVNAYHGQGEDGAEWGLARLIRAMAGIDGLERIRFTTSHPNDMDDDLIAAHGDCDKLMPYLHLPVQAGSDRVLKAMNRKHTGESYVRLIERIRAARPDLALSGDFIVGFPGETEADFQATLDLVEEVGYGSAYSFKYSARPGTPAAERAQVDPAEANDRLQRLQALLTQQQRAAQDAMVGREVVGPVRESRGACRVRWWASRNTSTPSTCRVRRTLRGGSRRLKSWKAGPIPCRVYCGDRNRGQPQHQELFVTSDTICCVAPAGLPTST
jgi:tRNA-2-methylthio-N6-dimethylallyladenosine synthase